MQTEATRTLGKSPRSESIIQCHPIRGKEGLEVGGAPVGRIPWNGADRIIIIIIMNFWSNRVAAAGTLKPYLFFARRSLGAESTSLRCIVHGLRTHPPSGVRGSQLILLLEDALLGFSQVCSNL